jgi:prepilin-type N-terminal cleavage/methylation domain-containing protein
MALPGHRIIHNHNGFSLFEIILAVLILAVAIVPMLNAFSPAIFATTAQEETAVFINQARGTLNRAAALDFDTLSSHQGNPVNLAALLGSQAEADKEAFTFRGQTIIPAVAITDFSAGAGGLLELTASIADVRVSTLKAEY